jgi:hypothetical protein
VKWRGRVSVSEYNAIFGEPVWDEISQRTGGRWNGLRLKLQLVSKRKTRWVVRAHHSPRGWKNKLATEENSAGLNAYTPTQRLPFGPLSEMPVYLALSERLRLTFQ